MAGIREHHFRRAAADIAAHGDNDTLPFDVDIRFINDKQDELVSLAYDLSTELARGGADHARRAIASATIFSERLLAPAGPSGFRIVTKIHPFWTIYFNGLGVAIAEALEPVRNKRVHSYRFAPQGDDLFDRSASWRAYRLATIDHLTADDAVVVQTDISSFYERVSHHRLENCIADLFPGDPTLAAQVDRILSQLASGRSFGLPVGGQGSRVLAELLLSMIDQQLDAKGIKWRRYVDDFVLTTVSHEEAYSAISALSHALADYGLSLNRNKTTVLSAKHYRDYVRTQLGLTGNENQRLMEIDLHFDPYSDNADAEFLQLRTLVETLDISALLDLELSKSQPDTFLVAQVGRTLRLHEPILALQLCRTLLSEKNLHAFRASWSTIMRGVAAVCADKEFESIFDGLDALIDDIPVHSSHLLTVEANCLHYLRVLRVRQTTSRVKFVQSVYRSTPNHTVRRACIDCWRNWRHRPSFTSQRNLWNSLAPEEQRMLWIAADAFGEEGDKFRKQVSRQVSQAWNLGFERTGRPSFASIFQEWTRK
ncbi:MAG: RNA-directed DNA polymerase [Vicinamibacterales bacterium]